MNQSTDRAASWVYQGIWGVLANILCVPQDAPVLPALEHEDVLAQKPSIGFIRYLKFQLLVGMTIAIIVISIGSLVIAAGTGTPWILLLTMLLLVITGMLGVMIYLGIYLRYDTTWYVLSDRSMRLRRGLVWIRESTISFENIQNVKVTQGPVERWFGIANVVVETAGGGGAHSEFDSGMGMHTGLIEGVAQAAEIRDSILARVTNAHDTGLASAGLGDEKAGSTKNGHRWSRPQLDVLREIRDLAQQTASQTHD